MAKKLPVVTIIGRPNIGKSSLFNRLLGERKAIVHDTPGTTRDRVEAIVEWLGAHFWLVDTAGAESGDSTFAHSIQQQINVAREEADIILLVVDGSSILSDEDARVIKQAHKTGKPIITAINKTDRAKQPMEKEKLPDPAIPVSAIHGTGSGDVLDAVVDSIDETYTEEITSVPSLALLGRPNVGKSSILNVLTDNERAIVSEQPGTTRDVLEVHMSHEDRTWRIADTAGLRRKTKPAKNSVERFSVLRSLGIINTSDVCVLVLDANEPATAQDQRIAGMVKEAGKGLILVVNKWDQTERSDAARNRIEYILRESFHFSWWAPLVLTSATEKHNISKLLPLASQVLERREQSVPTKDLNTVLRAAIAEHPPAGLKNRHPSLHYMTQTDTAPPTFAVFGKHTPFLHWSYKRYLETRLREEFDFTGTPIRLQWREKGARRRT